MYCRLRGTLLLFSLIPWSVALVMCFTVASHFLSILVLAGVSLASHPQWISSSSSTLSAQLNTSCGNTISCAPRYKSPAGKDQSRPTMTNSVVTGLLATFLASFQMLPLQAPIKAILWGSPVLLFGLSVHPPMQPFNSHLANIH